jgi:tetratricopeptide (TPR) repeat protein/Zn-dependent membrane protease YugP
MAFFYLPDLFGGTILLMLLGVLAAMGIVRRASVAYQNTISGEGSVPVSSGLRGQDVVQRLLAVLGLLEVRLVRSGRLNCYHPRRKEIWLQNDTYDSPALAATAIAAHEVGHAQQFATGYFACRLRRVFWPTCWVFLFLAFAILGLTFFDVALPQISAWLVALAFASLLMQLIVKIPLERDASRRARELVRNAGLINGVEEPIFDRILTSAGRTHLAAQAQRWIMLLMVLGIVGWGIPNSLADLEVDYPSVPAAEAPPPTQPPQQPVPPVAGAQPQAMPEPPPMEIIDLTGSLLTSVALAIPLVLVLVALTLMHGQGRQKPSTKQKAVLRNNAAMVMFDRGQREEAIKEYTAALQLDPAMIAARYNRGNCYLRLGKLDEAFADLDEAVRLAPSFADARALHGAVWSLRGDSDRALADFNEALRLAPQHPGALSCRGNFWLGRDNLDAALADFTAALEKAPGQADVLRDRGLCWLQKGVLYRAAADLDESIRLNPNDEVAFNNRGVVFLKAGDYRRALADLAEATRLAPDFPNPYKHRAWLQATCPQAEFRAGAEAVANATRALELTSWKQTEWLAVLAAAHAEAGKWEQAIDWQTKCLESAPPEQRTQQEQRLALYQAGQPFRDQPGGLLA